MRMPPGLRTVPELTRADLVSSPVWRNVYGTDAEEPWYEAAAVDEVTYRPWDGPLPYDCHRPVDRPPIVAATFNFADGTRMDGYMSPPGLWLRDFGSHLWYTQPALFLPDGTQCGFWSGGERQRQGNRSRLYAAVGKPATDVFPMVCRPLAGLINVEFETRIA